MTILYHCPCRKEPAAAEPPPAPMLAQPVSEVDDSLFAECRHDLRTRPHMLAQSIDASRHVSRAPTHVQSSEKRDVVSERERDHVEVGPQSQILVIRTCTCKTGARRRCRAASCAAPCQRADDPSNFAARRGANCPWLAFASFVYRAYDPDVLSHQPVPCRGLSKHKSPSRRVFSRPW